MSDPRETDSGTGGPEPSLPPPECTRPGECTQATDGVPPGETLAGGPLRRWSRAGGLLLALAVVTAFFVRMDGLAAAGLAEDEVNKLNAVAAYRGGSFVENTEHPMLMKALIWGSTSLAEAWNSTEVARDWQLTVPTESAVRFPNVLFGSLTVLALFLLAGVFFDSRTALLAAWFYAVAVPVVWINRIAKEDTLMVFFIVLGFYLHARMKRTPDSQASRKKRFYYGSAACLGAMLASKYMPHYLGLMLLFFVLCRRLNPRQYPRDSYNGWHALRYMAVLMCVFLLLNPVLLIPSVWADTVDYVRQRGVVHHGYFMMGELFSNSLADTPFGGTPPYFYLLNLAVKTPLAMLLTSAVGLALLLRRWREPGPLLVLFMLVFWLLPHSLSGAKFLRYTLSLMPFLCLAAAAGADQLARWLAGAVGRLWPGSGAGAAIAAITAAAAILLTSLPLAQTGPHYATFVNPLGGGRPAAAYYFPHDELYDLDLREAVRETAAQSPRRAVFCGDAPGVIRYYLDRGGRQDVRVDVLSLPSEEIRPDDSVYVFLQQGRQYRENYDLFLRLWNAGEPCLEKRLGDRPVVRVFRMNGRTYRSLRPPATPH